MIERWFPCSEVSSNSNTGWGSGNTERGLFTWFAARPAVQAKAAVICSLLPWPDDAERRTFLQTLVHDAMQGRYAQWKELRREILAANPDGAGLLDPFSGRGMIPLEASRLGLPTYAIDYSPLAVLASELLADYPFRNWSNEPPLPYQGASTRLSGTEQRLLDDVTAVLAEVGQRFRSAMDDFYPMIDGRRPWGYLWAVSLPCQECGRAFPLVGSYDLRKPSLRKARKSGETISDPGQSFYVDADPATDKFIVVVHDGPPERTPTLTNAYQSGAKVRGKSAICPFCGHVHPLEVHQRLAGEGLGRDVLLVVADIDSSVGKKFRAPTDTETAAIEGATLALQEEAPFGPMLPAIPDEQIPLNNGATIRPQLYGARTYGDLMCNRQTLGFVHLCRIIADLGDELVRDHGITRDYARALTSYAASTVVRKIKRSTRGTTLDVSRQGVNHIFVNESTIAFSYDFFEAGIGEGPGTWGSLVGSSVATLRSLLSDLKGSPTHVIHASAADQPLRNGSVAVVVTDPPYDSMVYYSDASDLFYAWLKRALYTTRPELAITGDSRGLQDKTDEIVVKEHGKAPGEHRDRSHYDRRIAKAFAEMRRVVRHDGLVTIVFGHGEPEVWKRLLGAIEEAGLIMTASWPANTESGGQQGKANIQTTLTMACRPAPRNRSEGRKASVEAEIKSEIKRRYLDWERWGLAPTDMLMAAAGPAMEVVGRYSVVRDARAEPVDIATFLPLARAAVQEAMALKIEDHPLDGFDARTRFALWWVRLFGREVAPKSELRWQTLAASLDLADVRDLIPDTDKGCRFTTAEQYRTTITPESAVIDVALRMARAQDEGLHAVGEILLASGRDTDDAYLWSAMSFLADRLPDSDLDAIAWTRILRNRSAVGSAAKAVIGELDAANRQAEAKDRQLRLL